MKNGDITLFANNFFKGIILKLLTGGLIALAFFVCVILFYDNFKQEGESVRRDRLQIYLQNSIEFLSADLLRKLQQYQIDAYSAIDNKIKTLSTEERENLLTWKEGSRRYSFFNKTNIEDIRFLIGGLHSDTIVPADDRWAYVLRFPAETQKKKFYITLRAPGELDGYLLSELDIDELLKIMQLNNNPEILLDSYLVTNLNKIVLAGDKKALGKDLSDVLIRKYDFYNAKNFIKITTNKDFKAIADETEVVHGFVRKPLGVGGRVLYMVVVGRDVSTEIFVSESTKNKLLGFIIFLFITVFSFAVLAFRNKNKVREFLKCVVDALPFATILKDGEGIPVIWNKAIEESFGLSQESLRKQLGKLPSKENDTLRLKSSLCDLKTESSCKLFCELENEDNSHGKNQKKYVLSTEEGHRHFESNVHELTDLDGKLLGAIEFIQDVTSVEVLVEENRWLRKQYRTVTETISEGVWLQNNETGEFVLSLRAKALLGFSDEELESSLDIWWSRVHIEDYSRVLEAHRMPSSDIPSFEVEYRIQHKNGHYLWIVTKGVGVWENGKLIQIIGCHKDVSDYKQQQFFFDVLYRISTARYLNRGLGRYLESVHSAVSSYIGLENFYVALWRDDVNTFEFIYYRDEKEGDQADNYTIQRSEFDEIPGLSGHVMRRGSTQLFNRHDEEMQSCVGLPAEHWLGVPLVLKRQPVGVITVQSYDAEHSFDANVIQLIEVVAEQISRAIERHQVHENLYHRATHDNLTGLLNREHFLNWGAKIVASKKRDDRSHALFMLDLNRFKQINDSLGHHIGDLVLIRASCVIREQLREVDTLARLGGDEFAVLLENAGSSAEVVGVAKRIINSFKSGMDIDGRHLVIKTSIGVVVEVEEYESINDAIRDADIAMYEAKFRSSQHFRVFNQKLHSRVQKKIEIEQVLTNEFTADEFIVHYQPIIDLVERKVAGFEALVRWRNPHFGALQPNVFLPVAEETGTIAKIDSVVLEQACQDLTHWRQQTNLANDLTVSVNVSQSELIDVYLPKKIIDCTKRHNIDTSSILIELTESAFIRNLQMAKKLLDALRKDGVAVRMDDFGTGYSSLAHLADLPFDALKIDKSFIGRAERSEQGLTVLNTLVTMSKSLRMPVVAEGIETMDQLSLITDLGCRYGQGYYFAKPMRQDVVIDYLKGFSLD